MSQSLPPEPPSGDRRPRQRLEPDEWIAIGVTLLTLGGIFFWGLRTAQQPLFVIKDDPASPSSARIILESPPTPQASPLPPRTSQIPVTPSSTPSPTRIPPVVSVSHWAQPFADRLAEKGYLTEKIRQNWQPEREITREELAAEIVSIFDQRSPVQSPKAFPDVPPDTLAQQTIDRAVALGFMQGYAEGVFRPEQKITRLELLVALASGLKLASPPNPQEILKIYPDQSQIPPWAVPKIAAATQSQLVVNYPQPRQLDPLQPVSQGEAIAMLHQALVVSGQIPPLSSPYILPSP